MKQIIWWIDDNAFIRVDKINSAQRQDNKIICDFEGAPKFLDFNFDTPQIAQDVLNSWIKLLREAIE